MRYRVYIYLICIEIVTKLHSKWCSWALGEVFRYVRDIQRPKPPTAACVITQNVQRSQLGSVGKPEPMTFFLGSVLSHIGILSQ